MEADGHERLEMRWLSIGWADPWEWREAQNSSFNRGWANSFTKLKKDGEDIRRHLKVHSMHIEETSHTGAHLMSTRAHVGDVVILALQTRKPRLRGLQGWSPVTAGI